MKPIRVVDLRVLLEAACGVGLALALLMPFFTVSAQSLVPVSSATSIVNGFPQNQLADLFVSVAVLALILSVVRVLRASCGVPLMLLSLASFVVAVGLVVVMQAQWTQATSGWQMDAARLLGVQFSQTFGFWVYLGAGIAGGGLVLSELVSLLRGRPAKTSGAGLRSGGAPLQPHGAELAAAGTARSAPVAALPERETRAGPIAQIVSAPAAPVAPAEAAGTGRVGVVESGQSTEVMVARGQSLVCGRDAGCGIRLTDPRVSRRHAAIERVNGGWVVRDLGATNPTLFLDSGGTTVEVGPEARVTSGQLLVGDVLVTLYP